MLCFQKQPPLFMKVSQIPQENTCAEVSFKKKFQACKPISCFFLYTQQFMLIMSNTIVCINRYLNKS